MSAIGTWDAESQMKTAAGVNYTYDGDGKRVMKSSGRIYWYGMGGDPLDETDSAGNTNNSSFFEYAFFNGQRIARRDYQNNVNYYFADHLGTARVVTSSSGAVLDDSDFYPFGGERPITSSSGNAYKFTSKERDSESGLDNFGARFYSSSLGRFTTIDPIVISNERMLDPQQLNAYSYARGSPLRFVDPQGEEVRLADLSEEDRQKLIAELQKETGLTLQYNEKTGDLDVVGDPSKATTGSTTFRQGLLTAINSKEVYNVLDRSEYRGETVDTGVYDREKKTLVLNFSNILGVEAKHPQDVDLGTTFYHELVGHGIEGLRDELPWYKFWGPVAVDRENVVRQELGMYQRDGWKPYQCGNGTCSIALFKNLNNGITD